MNLDALPISGVKSSPLMSHFPVALIDVAVIVDEDVPAADVARGLSDGAGRLLENIHMFDVYRGETIGAGRKSLAYKLTFRAPDRTLTAEETWPHVTPRSRRHIVGVRAELRMV